MDSGWGLQQLQRESLRWKGTNSGWHLLSIRCWKNKTGAGRRAEECIKGSLISPSSHLSLNPNVLDVVWGWLVSS